MSMPDEVKDFTAASFNDFLTGEDNREKRLRGVRCKSCGRLSVEPRPTCPSCHGKDMEWFQFSGKGRLSTFTCISIVSNAMADKGYGRDNPCCTGIVTLEEGPRISARILGVDGNNPQDLKTEIDMRFDLEDVDPEDPSVTFRPV